MRRIREIMRKEFLQLRRDHRMLPMLFLAPVIQLLLLGYAATTDLGHVPVALCNLDRSIESHRLIESFTSGGDLYISHTVDHPDHLNVYLDKGLAALAVVIPPDYGRKTNSGEVVDIQVLVDGTKVNATSALAQLQQAVGRHAQDIVSARMVARGMSIKPPEVRAETRVWYNPELTSRNFMVPGVFALILLIITMVVTSMAIVKERETGTMDQIIVTPIKPRQLILGKLIPFAIVGFIEVLLVFSVAVFWFDIPMRGSAALLLTLCVLFMLTSQGLGLFVSTVSHTQQQAMMTAVFFVVLPMVLLSGFVFPIEDMPKPVQYITYLMPLRYFLVILRGVFLKGVGVATLWPQIAALVVFGVVILVLASARFQKRAG